MQRQFIEIVLRGAIGAALLLAMPTVADAQRTPLELTCKGLYTDYSNNIRDIEITGIYARIEPSTIEISGMGVFETHYTVTKWGKAWVSFAESDDANAEILPLDEVQGRFGSINRLDGKLTVFLKNRGPKVSNYMALDCAPVTRIF